MSHNDFPGIEFTIFLFIFDLNLTVLQSLMYWWLQKKKSIHTLCLVLSEQICSP